MNKDETLRKLKRATDIINESGLVTTILRYARSGHATELMVEQAIVMIEKHIACAVEDGDESWRRTAEELRHGLRQALKVGIGTLRGAEPPGPERTKVEEPLARLRTSRGHTIIRQKRFSGGVIDVYDVTADELIECKHRGTSAALGEAAGQLMRYRRSFPGASIAIAVVSIESEARWLAEVLRGQGIEIIECDSGQCEELPASPHPDTRFARVDPPPPGEGDRARGALRV